MASYHFSVQVVKRSAGRSVIAMAAYRAGERLHNVRRNVTEDYSHRRGVVHREIMAPEGSASWLTDRETLWNAVEAGEKRVDAQLARELNVALPHELTPDQRLELIRGFIAEQFVSRGMVADLAIHEPVIEKGDNPLNYHAHVLLTLRQATPEGLRPVKTREWNSDSMLAQWRAAWADHQNRSLVRHGHEISVDHRSLAAQFAEARAKGDRKMAFLLDRKPEIHVGPLARQAASHGGRIPSKDRLVGPKRHRQPGAPPSRRLRVYTHHDRGNRLDWVRTIVRRNAERSLGPLHLIEMRKSRLETKLAYWTMRAKHGLEQVQRHRLLSRGARLTATRALSPQDLAGRAHAMKRVDLLQRLIQELSNVLRAARRQQEVSLMRGREFEGWLRNLSRLLDRGSGGRSLEL